jgi:hypothetical protein
MGPGGGGTGIRVGYLPAEISWAVICVTAHRNVGCGMMRSYEEGEAHCVDFRGPLCQFGGLLRPIDGGDKLDGLLRLDAVPFSKPSERLLRSATSRPGQSPSTDKRRHCPNCCFCDPGHTSALECGGRRNKGCTQPSRVPQQLSARRALHHLPFLPDLAPSATV